MNPMFTSINGLIAYTYIVDNTQHAGLSVLLDASGLAATCSLDGKTVTFGPRDDGAAGQQAQVKDNLAVFAPDRKFIGGQTCPRYGFAIAPQDKL